MVRIVDQRYEYQSNEQGTQKWNNHNREQRRQGATLEYATDYVLGNSDLWQDQTFTGKREPALLVVTK